MNNQPPSSLYKYKEITSADRDGPIDQAYTKKLLTEGELYFARFSELRDPNEALFFYADNQDEYRIAVSSDELEHYPYKKIIEQLPDGRYHLSVNGITAAKRIRDQLDQRWGVLCLTERSDDLLMFDYYANAHRGICIEFDWRKFNIVYRNSNGQLQLPVRVKYSDYPFALNKSNLDTFNELFYTKWEQYSHEKEWRLFYVAGALKHINVLNSIKSITFGCATPEKDKELVRDWLKNRTDINFYQAKLQSKKYALDIIKL